MPTTPSDTTDLGAFYEMMTSTERVLARLERDGVDVANLSASDVSERDLDCQNLGAFKVLTWIADTVARRAAPTPDNTAVSTSSRRITPSATSFLVEWLDTMEPTVRPSTFESYSRNIHNHVIAHIGALRLRKVDAGTLNGLYALLLRSGRRAPSRMGRGYSAAVLDRAPSPTTSPRTHSPRCSGGTLTAAGGR